MKKRENSAERVKDVLDLLNARRRSGLLSVERFVGGRFEEGEIYFEQGRPTYARTGDLNGKDALSWLTNWREVYFAFDKDAPLPTTGSLSITGKNAAQSKTASLLISGKNVSRSTKGDVSTTGKNAAYPPINGSSTKDQDAAHATMGDVSTMGKDVAYPTTGDLLLTGEDADYPTTGGLFVGPRSPTSPLPPAEFSPDMLNASLAGLPLSSLELRVPQRLPTDLNVLSLPLTRAHRSVYLLMDGQRSVADLARCTGKTIQQIRTLLNDLLEQELISL